MLAVVVLLCLMVLTLIAGSILRGGHTRREARRAQERRLQAEWLAEAGLQRGRADWRPNPATPARPGISTPALDSADAATVTITVECPKDQATPRTIRAAPTTRATRPAAPASLAPPS